MITFEDAIALVERELSKMSPFEDDQLVVYREQTIERPFGWVLFWGSALYAKTGDVRYALAGNAPFIVNRQSGGLVLTSTALPVTHFIQQYEAGQA